MMTKKIFRSIGLTSLIVFLAALALIMGVLYQYFSAVQQNQLEALAVLAARGVEKDGADFFTGLDMSKNRVTWVSPDGSVLFDSEAEASAMENHLDREEIREALETGSGESSRYSSTLLQKLVYVAVRLADGSVVRVGARRNTVASLLLGVLQPMLIVAVIAVVLAFVLASRLSKRIVKPLNALDLDDPLKNDGFDELSPLLRRLDSQQRQIKLQSNELRRRRDEFEAITGSMSEGLVLLNEKGVILSLNRAASKLLNAPKGCVGGDMLAVNRSLDMQELLESALSGRAASRVMELGGGEYQLQASPVLTEGEVTGAVLLMFDVTERERAEAMRREFTANVSHELKTPLHSISGCAELLQSGLVKPEDEQKFFSQIFGEARRMTALVDDIIRLSRLDEGAPGLKREDCELHSLAKNVLSGLESEAAEAGVALKLTGGETRLKGVPQLLSAIIFNLTDNAIKYNHPGGEVEVTTEARENEAVLTVRDTGVGIPPEHQPRVFERFYRVDKSRSKEVGGTGLGLSIVKHAARLHDAKIDLQSKAGEGTTVKVSFPS